MLVLAAVRMVVVGRVIAAADAAARAATDKSPVILDICKNSENENDYRYQPDGVVSMNLRKRNRALCGRGCARGYARRKRGSAPLQKPHEARHCWRAGELCTEEHNES